MWGSLAGQPDAGYPGLGAGNKATFLDGENGSISIKDAPGLHFSGNITMMAWVKPGAKDYYRDILARGWNDIYAETFLRISRSDDGTGGGTTQNFYELGVSDGSDATYYDVALYEIPPVTLATGSTWPEPMTAPIGTSIATARSCLLLPARTARSTHQ